MEISEIIITQLNFKENLIITCYKIIIKCKIISFNKTISNKIKDKMKMNYKNYHKNTNL